MSNPGTPRALIIGGSLGGLATAVALRAIGWRVDVFERSPHALDSRGGGLVLQPDVLELFEFAGLAQHAPLAVPSADRIFLDRKGDVVQRGYQPQSQTSWNMLYSTMRASLPDDCVHPGLTLESFTQEGNQVSARFTSGRVESGDLLVGADGAHSTVRKLLLPNAVPAYAGYVAWRGLVPEMALAAQHRRLLDGVFAFQHEGDNMLLEYMVPGEDGATEAGRRRWNWVWFRKIATPDLPAVLTDRDGRTHLFSLPPGALREHYAEALRRDAGQLLAPPFSALVQHTAEPFIQLILDLEVEQMVFGRVLLLGDAAFVPRPHTAGGSAKAAANALALALALKRTDRPIEQALRSWESFQLKAGLAMTASGKRMGNQIMRIDDARWRK
jgi:2-polyprenyl-6-methoxyphenol hydroxylase-like FAD-dependent oxidoreductase